MALALPGGGASLRARLMALSVVALLPGFGVVGYTEYQVDRSRKAEVQDLAVRSARQAAFELDRMISGVRSVLVAVSEASGVREPNDGACSAYLRALGPRLTNLTKRPCRLASPISTDRMSILEKVARKRPKKDCSAYGRRRAGLGCSCLGTVCLSQMVR